jgi:hypothetical protein
MISSLSIKTPLIRLLIITLLLALAIPVLQTTPAQAADPAFCAHYAHQAVWQYERNRSIPGCFHGGDLRWNPNYDAHYGWCLSAAYDAARTEDSYRGDRLHECMFRAYGHY